MNVDPDSLTFYSLEVENCIVCLKKATVFTGHLLLKEGCVPLNIIKVGAGFCKKHNKDEFILAPEKFGIKGCFGEWKPKYGIQVSSWDDNE